MPARVRAWVCRCGCLPARRAQGARAHMADWVGCGFGSSGLCPPLTPVRRPVAHSTRPHTIHPNPNSAGPDGGGGPVQGEADDQDGQDLRGAFSQLSAASLLVGRRWVGGVRGHTAHPPLPPTYLNAPPSPPFQAFASRKGVAQGSLRFFLDGERCVLASLCVSLRALNGVAPLPSLSPAQPNQCIPHHQQHPGPPDARRPVAGVGGPDRRDARAAGRRLLRG